MKNASVGSLVDDMVEERIPEVEDTHMSVETFQMKNKGKRRENPEYPRTMALLQKVYVCVMGIPEGGKSSFNI